MDVSISIINYYSSDLVVKAIESIIRYTKNIKFEIIVTNNSPSDKEFSNISNRFNDLNIIILESGENLGFSRANNIAFKHSTGRYFLIYNPDLFLIQDSINICIEFLEQNPSYVATTVKFIYPDGTFQPSAFYKQNGGRFFYGSIPYITKFFKKHTLENQLPSMVDKVVDVKVLCGAFLFIRSNTYKDIKGFDEEFFLYGEDWEISYRISNYGKMALLNSTSVVHMHGGTSEREFLNEESDLNLWSRKGTQMFVSILLWQKKEFGIWIMFKLYILIIFGLLLSFAGLVVRRFGKTARGQWANYFQNTLIITKHVFQMVRGKVKVYKAM